LESSKDWKSPLGLSRLPNTDNLKQGDSVSNTGHDSEAEKQGKGECEFLIRLTVRDARKQGCDTQGQSEQRLGVCAGRA
jgi:hypothetical protein